MRKEGRKDLGTSVPDDERLVVRGGEDVPAIGGPGASADSITVALKGEQAGTVV